MISPAVSKTLILKLGFFISAFIDFLRCEWGVGGDKDYTFMATCFIPVLLFPLLYLSFFPLPFLGPIHRGYSSDGLLFYGIIGVECRFEHLSSEDDGVPAELHSL